MTRMLIAAAAIAALVFSTPAAIAVEGKPKTDEKLNAGMKEHGCKHELLSDEEQSTILITCALEVVSRDKGLRKWFFVSDLTDSDISRHRLELTASFAARLAAEALLFYYKTSEIDQLAVVGRVMGRDDYGHPVDHIAFTYSFDRLTYQKIDPDHIKLSNIIRKISKEPEIPNWARAILLEDMFLEQ